VRTRARPLSPLHAAEPAAPREAASPLPADRTAGCLDCNTGVMHTRRRMASRVGLVAPGFFCNTITILPPVGQEVVDARQQEGWFGTGSARLGAPARRPGAGAAARAALGPAGRALPSWLQPMVAPFQGW